MPTGEPKLIRFEVVFIVKGEVVRRGRGGGVNHSFNTYTLESQGSRHFNPKGPDLHLNPGITLSSYPLTSA